MPDGCTITLPVPPEALARLKEAEARQRNETKNRGLPAEFVSVEGLLLLQRNNCGRCNQPLDFLVRWDFEKPPALYPVIAHKLLRKRAGGHVPSNVAIWHHGCNHQEASKEKTDTSKGDRMAVDFTRKLLAKEERKRGSIKSRGFQQRPDGATSWPKRSFGRKA